MAEAQGKSKPDSEKIRPNQIKIVGFFRKDFKFRNPDFNY